MSAKVQKRTCSIELANVSGALLGDGLGCALWLGRELKHRYCLILVQHRQQLYATVRKFNRIVVRSRLVLVDLPKDGRPMGGCCSFQAQEPIRKNPDIVGESQFCSRQ